MKLAEVSVKRPVFAVMMSAALVVLGWFSYRDLGLDLMPRTDSPTVNVRASLPGASAEEIETTITKDDRGRRQHDQRHRRAPLQLVAGQRQLHDHVHARARHRGGDAGRPRQGRDGPISARHDASGRQQVRSGPGADPDAGGRLAALAEGNHRDRRQADQGSARDRAGRRRSLADGRSPARDPHPARPQPAQRLRVDGAAGRHGGRSAEHRDPRRHLHRRAVGNLDADDGPAAHGRRVRADRALLSATARSSASATSRASPTRSKKRAARPVWTA